jgi:predicted aldo/keto reductase-like oxidoreductase
MIYKTFKNLRLSSLGFGVMRLPATGPGYGAPINHKKAAELLEYAYEHGVNYYDTSYFYHGGESERFLGKVMGQVPRESWYLASKLPGNLMRFDKGKLEVSGTPFANPKAVFDFQMERCGVDYFDFFLLHNVSETTYDIYTNDELGIIDCLLEQKAKGRIRHLGFSSHGRHDTIDKFLNYLAARGCNDFEFVMIQLNYMDWILQEANKKYEVITKHGLPVFVMEPLRGGRLANLNPAADALLKAARPNHSHAEWAFRYLQALSNVPVILSGMSSLEQLKENLKIFSAREPVTQNEILLLQKVMETMVDTLPCTSCQYCMEECPQNLDIPMLLTMYNEAKFEMGWFFHAALRAISNDKKPAACIFCGKCVPLCPQNINIPEALEKFSKIIS